MRQTMVHRCTRAATGAAVLATAALISSAVSGEATASPRVAHPCGYSIDGIEAYYNHCTSDGSHILIREDRVGELDKNVCVGPGSTHLGPALIVRYARYIGKLC
ncbi:DUF6355 family natural product biosynthesis protein [Amycolatopsis sp. PS_44_ISF1]|uniref:DUF6355 family natural product biosynthesis protein n=1 Tax=Amycolatopsis sp. PS_44_ISF1 TaxID=2974917 RepID=UPI0028DD5728|nr:DUF6355 family natural product biosynthesis protein [Amycolatopsis sp. PS_44_ISF1]MDT8910041.1 DUF6355 family natural product biosynthesis protein [Amycolatopsis sp. PS_44_ISF1]